MRGHRSRRVREGRPRRDREHAGASDPDAKGRIRATFTGNEIGRTVAAHAKGFAKEVDLCLEGLMPAAVSDPEGR